MNNHLVILKKQYIDAILDGSKTIESRLYKSPMPPFGCIASGDKLYLKVSSGPVCATAEVDAVKSFENLTPEAVLDLKEKYNSRILGADEYWQMKSDSRVAVLVKLKNAQPIPPFNIDKKDWRAWAILTDGKDFGILKST